MRKKANEHLWNVSNNFFRLHQGFNWITTLYSKPLYKLLLRTYERGYKKGIQDEQKYQSERIRIFKDL